MSDSWTGVSISSRDGHLRIFPVSPSWSGSNHGATEAVRSVAQKIGVALPKAGVTTNVITDTRPAIHPGNAG